jgi:hypothetical protein
MRSWKFPPLIKYTAWLVLCLAVLSALTLVSGPGLVQAQQASDTPYPGPFPTYPSGNQTYPEPQTATFAPSSTPALATTPAGLPFPTSQATAALPSPTLPPAQTLPGTQSPQDLQANPQPSGPAPTYAPLPAITFQLPDLSATESASQPQASPTPVAAQGNGGADRWIPLAVIVVIWGLLAGWFYLSFRRLG